MDNYADDIPLAVAYAAHAGTSFSPDERARGERASYAATLADDFTTLSKYATTDEKRATLAEEFARYRERFRRLTLDLLRTRSRCMSTMITGGSNFPVRRQEKINRVADARVDRLLEFRGRALAAIKRILTPELAPIMAGDGDAAERIREKLGKLEQLQALMVAANKEIRKHAKAGADAQIAALVALGLPERTAAELLKPDFAGRVGFADYATKNGGAEIRRLKERLASVEAAKATPETVTEGERARLEDVPADNRIRLFFPGKPDADVRARLKAAGFRWAPTIGCWQAYRGHHAIVVAKQEAGVQS